MPDRPTARPLLGLGILLILAGGAFRHSIALPELWRGLLLGVGVALLVGELARWVFPAKSRKPR